ncbi:GDSL-like lipase/acylhydrolase family protein [Formosa agariphila KMM 3901]|uniref:GDSL-like lipase/acylhydrolase family protein n=1 Tax=Formosa agariphila (strain DSM 15362 / KCTC 12365 / LMG 23005 / KMM 3901 / M-2Alg 35-1) TaxID=1347342 RepID=T2KQC8_FORAG|nr:lipase [Formosa agariphila]CDF81037.1 GDSL-like lipase/acylhydrolase family protein [Formosa agariphila KMM 3901]
MKVKYIWLAALSLTFAACNNDDDNAIDDNTVIYPELTAGTADFSNYVSIGNSLTSGYTDNSLFIAAQENSFPKMLSERFELAGGGTFTQPLTNDNYGGLAAAGTRLPGFNPRLVTTGGSPLSLESVIGPVTVTTDIVLNNPTGPFNNMGVPGAKSFHLLANGYGNIANLSAGLANPYFIRMTGSTPDVSMLELTMAQNPTFFSLWIGNNDILGYATSGGDGSNPITDGPTFDYVYSTLVNSLTSAGAKGVVANIPYVTSIAHFTTVPYNPLDPTNPSFGPLIPTLNTVYGALNQIFDAYGQSQRNIVFTETSANAVVIKDESLSDMSAEISGALLASPTFPAFLESMGLPAAAAPIVAPLLGSFYGQARQATEDDLFVLPSSAVIGTINQTMADALIAQGLSENIANQFSAEGITLPLEDKWVLIPSEQTEIKTATDQFNSTIKTIADQAGLAHVDANWVLQQVANPGGYGYGEFILNSNLVTGGAFSLDGVHPTSRGYALIANEFMKAIDATYESNFEASGNFTNLGDYPTNYSPLLQ